MEGSWVRRAVKTGADACDLGKLTPVQEGETQAVHGADQPLHSLSRRSLGMRRGPESAASSVPRLGRI